MVEGLDAFAPNVVELDRPDEGEPAHEVRPDVVEENEDDQGDDAPANPILILHDDKSRDYGPRPG